MVQYKFNKCNKVFKQKSNYLYHIKRKNPCVHVYQDNNQMLDNDDSCDSSISESAGNFQQKVNKDHPINNRQCQYCEKIFTRIATLNKHINERCKVKKTSDAQKENLLEKLVTEMENIKTQIDLLQKENNEYKRQKNLIL